MQWIYVADNSFVWMSKIPATNHLSSTDWKRIKADTTHMLLNGTSFSLIIPKSLELHACLFCPLLHKQSAATISVVFYEEDVNV